MLTDNVVKPTQFHKFMEICRAHNNVSAAIKSRNIYKLLTLTLTRFKTYKQQFYQ